jgi:hypothetical protein
MIDGLFTQQYPTQLCLVHRVQEEENPWQLPFGYQRLVLQATRKRKFTFPIFAVGAILSSFLAITISLVLDITVPGI